MPYRALCCVNVDVAVGLNEYNVDVPNTVLCHILLKYHIQ